MSIKPYVCWPILVLTPRRFYVDDSRECRPHGVLLMEYLPGDSLDYGRDLEEAARLFAHIHSQTAQLPEHHLIVEEYPLTMTYQECAGLLQIYFDSTLSDPDIRGYLQEVLVWAEMVRHQERYFTSSPWPCIINTAVNSGNFIANREAGSLHLADWEKPLWGDPSQDLSHFLCAHHNAVEDTMPDAKRGQAEIPGCLSCRVKRCSFVRYRGFCTGG